MLNKLDALKSADYGSFLPRLRRLLQRACQKFRELPMPDLVMIFQTAGVKC
jgi:hypothetical protein